jgi:hypothetical protein
MTLAGLPALEQLQAVQAQGATARDMAWLITVAAPHLIPRWRGRSPLVRLEALSRWTRMHMKDPNPILPDLLSKSSVPWEAQERDSQLLEGLGLFPDWFRRAILGPGDLAFPPGLLPASADLDPWLEGHPVNLDLEGPPEFLKLPDRLALHNRLRISGMSRLERLRSDAFQGLDGELVVAHCPNLLSIHGFAKAVRVHIKDCPRLERIQLHSTRTQSVQIEACPSLAHLCLSHAKVPHTPPDLVIKGCQTLETISPGLERHLHVRHLILEDCPRLRELPRNLKVRGTWTVAGCPGLSKHG